MQIAQIAVNQRFALFYPEKRPFFLEGLELFSTPIQTVYTRSITSPRWGLRATGKFDSNQYTAFIAEDRGGGRVILPGPTSSSFADQDFSSFVGMGRLRHDFGHSFASLLLTDREVEDASWRGGLVVRGQFSEEVGALADEAVARVGRRARSARGRRRREGARA